MSCSKEKCAAGQECDFGVPELTGLQFLVVAILFAGEMTSSELHCELARRGCPRNKASFSGLMRRLVDASIVTCTARKDRTGKQKNLDYVNREHIYRGTNLGLVLWEKAKNFYSQMESPADDYEPDNVMREEDAELEAKERKKIGNEQFVKEVMDTVKESVPDSWRKEWG